MLLVCLFTGDISLSSDLYPDIAFRDSHALWAQHATGSFSQFDLRDVTKPIDSMPRVAATWDVSGSVTFVADVNDRWEIPYDDM